MQSDPRYVRIKNRLRELEAELTKAGFKGQISKITDIQREIDDLYRELGPQCIQSGSPAHAIGTVLKGPSTIRLKTKAQNVTGRIWKGPGPVLRSRKGGKNV